MWVNTTTSYLVWDMKCCAYVNLGWSSFLAGENMLEFAGLVKYGNIYMGEATLMTIRHFHHISMVNVGSRKYNIRTCSYIWHRMSYVGLSWHDRLRIILDFNSISVIKLVYDGVNTTTGWSLDPQNTSRNAIAIADVSSTQSWVGQLARHVHVNSPTLWWYVSTHRTKSSRVKEPNFRA